MTREGLYYTKDHEWVRLDADGTAVMGITDHAQKALGDITFVDLPKIGKTVRARDPLAVVESVKAASDVFAPVGGAVSAVNAALAKTPEKINQSPYDEGWICRLANVNRADAERLLSASDYEKLIAAEA